MPDTDIKKETQEYLHAASLNIVVLLDHVRSFEGRDQPTRGFSGPAFKKTIDGLATAIDKEVTRFMIACKPPALDAEIRALCPKISAGFFQLVQHFNSVPKSAGRTYVEAVRRAISRSLLSIVTLTNSFIENKVVVDKAVLAELAYTSSSGIFWEHCKALAQIPADNKAAVAAQWKSVVGDLVKDAVEELKASLEDTEESKKSGGSAEENGYSSDESMGEFDPDIPVERLEEGRKILQLVTTAKHTCDKVGLRCIRDCEALDSERTIWLDRLLDLGKVVQEAVDELVAVLFIEDDTWRSRARVETGKLTKALLDLITLAITFVDDAHLAWFELCRKKLDAAKHESKIAR
ncbi:hypothetical protein GQ54DRAFT_67181 [Martensiomyces pterosporus]|nr:hypothetical protein GQ54DRAFT_67181 [Martensiomyces pterosporus]